MPIYEYKCGKCGAISEVLVGVGDNEVKIKCSQCGSELLERIVSSTFTVAGAKSKKATSNATSCCGTNNPCDDPKRCCSDH